MAAQRTESILDTTRRLEWVVTKEMLESCDIGGWINSGVYNVKIGGQTSKWKIHLGRARTDTKAILIVLEFLGEDVKVEVQDIGIKSEAGYWSCEPSKLDFTQHKEKFPISKIVSLSKDKDPTFCHTQAGTEENFLKKFSKNKITVMAVIRFYVNPNETEYTKSIENNENSVTIEDATPDIVEAMLEFMDRGVIPRDIEEKAIDLIALADKYDLQDLIKVCENSLADNLTVENVIETLIAIDLRVPNSQHRQKIVNFIKAEGEQVVKSRDWNKFIEKYPNLVTEIFLSALREPRTTVGN